MFQNISDTMLASPAQGRRLISLCVCTFRRPENLTMAITSLLGQNIPADWYTEIIVVDNDATGSAKVVIEQMPMVDRHRVKYFIEPQSGVSHARNRCLSEAQGEIVTFIDDDEWADSNWLVMLVGTLDRSEASAAFGPVKPIYALPPPAWLTRGSSHHRTRFPTGTDLAWGDAQTNNVAIRRSLIEQGLHFSAVFAKTGGEDSFFFAQAISRGHRLVWCNEACVNETIPAYRMTRRWVLERAFHGGRTYVRLHHQLGNSWAYVTMGIWGLLYAIILAGPVAILAIFCSPWHMRYASKLAGNIGKLVARFYNGGKYSI